MNGKIKIIIADDHPLLRQGLISILSQQENIEILGEAADGATALRLIKELKPGIAVLDVQMPEPNGYKVAQIITSEQPQTKIIFLTMFNEEAFVKKAFNLGVRGYILKENAILDIAKCISAVAEGRTYLSPQVSELLLKKETKSVPTENEILTPSELKILKLIGEDKSSKEIADELFLSLKTVGNHRNNICKKLGITGNSALVKYALKQKQSE